jgi:YtkA-like
VVSRSNRLRAVVRAISLLATLLCTACGGEQAPLQTAPLVFSGAPAETATSKGGQLLIDIRWSWSPPVVGYDASEMTITDRTGAPATGLTLTIVPWMPAHGHSASVAPTVSETSPGVYVAAPLDFYMSGTWQLLTTITGTGSIDDSAQPSVDIP